MPPATPATKREPVPAPTAQAVEVAPVPVAAPRAASGQSLEGSTWKGKGSMGASYHFEFRPGGLLRYQSNGKTYDNGRWVQTGTKVAIDMNDHYADYDGTIEGDSISGTAHNKPGASWTWSITRQA